MTKIICDCCGREVLSLRNFRYLIHLDENYRTKMNCRYQDSEGNYSSGRYEEKDLCQKCYNEIMMTAVKKFESLREEHNASSKC